MYDSKKILFYNRNHSISKSITVSFKVYVEFAVDWIDGFCKRQNE